MGLFAFSRHARSASVETRTVTRSSFPDPRRARLARLQALSSRRSPASCRCWKLRGGMPTVTTRARAEASRRNGRRSRGPVTAKGKMRSSRNATRHGILTENVTASDPPEQQEAFAALLNQLQAELAPSSLLESLLVERIAAALWRTRRVLDFEAGSALERHAASDPFERLLGDLSTDVSDPEARERGLALSRSLAPEEALDRAVRYEAHLTRELGRLLSQLEQARRLSALDGFHDHAD